MRIFNGDVIPGALCCVHFKMKCNSSQAFFEKKMSPAFGVSFAIWSYLIALHHRKDWQMFIWNSQKMVRGIGFTFCRRQTCLQRGKGREPRFRICPTFVHKPKMFVHVAHLQVFTNSLWPLWSWETDIQPNRFWLPKLRGDKSLLRVIMRQFVSVEIHFPNYRSRMSIASVPCHSSLGPFCPVFCFKKEIIMQMEVPVFNAHGLREGFVSGWLSVW